ncbi:25148_t:CDS:1, partial [Racocetra persica]
AMKIRPLLKLVSRTVITASVNKREPKHPKNKFALVKLKIKGQKR